MFLALVLQPQIRGHIASMCMYSCVYHLALLPFT